MPAKNVGRYTSPEEKGRYTPPIPRSVKKSPRWFGVLVLAALVLGVLTIVLNYVGLLPASPSPWYLVAGLAVIFVGFVLATRYR